MQGPHTIKNSQIILIGLSTYIAMAWLLTGNVFRPIFFLTFWIDRLGAPYWPALLLVGIGLSLIIAKGMGRIGFDKQTTFGLFVFFSMCLSTGLIAAYASYLRLKESAAFQADREFRNSFFASLRNAPADFQFFLHGAALKDCVPYTWSYSYMAYGELSKNIAINVLPYEWLDECAIEADR
ncbi:hypothetical protein [Ruegeria atlantica]|uniref:Uncharacterized protein n=1 Tax=Ruegeria atlantica TaxID=81569 RepID=A0A0N7LRD5_9RHOB|nr:hypothetical protein [Ruegeria atlantica]CUH50516.1 hypothetical protein RUA4292_04725 [Ruegeria atlantica]